MITTSDNPKKVPNIQRPALDSSHLLLWPVLALQGLFGFSSWSIFSDVWIVSRFARRNLCKLGCVWMFRHLCHNCWNIHSILVVVTINHRKVIASFWWFYLWLLTNVSQVARQQPISILVNPCRIYVNMFFKQILYTWGTPGIPFLVQIHKSCLFIVFDGFHVQDRKFTPFPIAERFFTSFWLNCVQITFTLRSNCVQITFNYVQVAQNYVQCHRLKALYEKPSRTTIPVQLSNSLLFLIWTGKGVLGVPQVYIIYAYYPTSFSIVFVGYL